MDECIIITDGKDEEAIRVSLGKSYTILKGEFPVTNHSDVDEANLGWVKGVFDDGTPFEAELWEYEGHTNVTILIPADCWDIPINNTEPENGIIPFCTSNERVNGGVLPVGMVVLGVESNNDIIINLVDYLEEEGFIDFVAQWRNGFVQYVEDINGNTFCEIIIELEDEENIYAEVDIDWYEFPMRKKKTKKVKPFTIVR